MGIEINTYVEEENTLYRRLSNPMGIEFIKKKSMRGSADDARSSFQLVFFSLLFISSCSYLYFTVSWPMMSPC